MTDEQLLMRCVEFHKALSNPVRLRIVEELLEGELCQCEILPRIGLAQPTISAYLSQLVRVGILAERREGKRKLYRIASHEISELMRLTRKAISSMMGLGGGV